MLEKGPLKINVNDFYKPLFESAVEGMIVSDRNGKIVLLNKRAEQLFGYKKGELINESVQKLIPHPRRGGHEDNIKQYFKKPKARLMGHSQLIGLKKSGEQFPVEIGLNYFESSGVTYALALVTDVTERKKAEEKIKTLTEKLEEKVASRTEKLAESRQLYRTIARNFPEGTINVFNKSFEYVFVEGMELYKLGVTSDELLGSNYADRLPPSISNEVIGQLKQVFNGIAKTFDVTIQRHTYELNAVPLATKSGEINQILVIEKNITKKKRAEEEIKRTLEKEKELNNLKSRFVSMASHEFRTPLSTILSSASLLRKYQGEDQQKQRDKHIDRITSSVHNLTGILEDFLSLDRLEEGKIKAKPAAFDFIEICNTLIEDLKSILKKGQTIVQQHEKKELQVTSDKGLLRNVLINLLSNAVKYSDEGQTIIVKTKLQNDLLKLSVIDEGIGIPIGEQNHLFERFFRANNAFNLPGTGLGLNIVKKYVELVQGNIQFESKEGVGSTFTITIPIKLQS